MVWTVPHIRKAAAAAALAVVTAATAGASAAEWVVADAPELWDLELGAHAAELDASAFGDYACGTNGGPPSKVIAGWTAYAECPPEEGSGLHEVQFRYDDEAEYLARAFHNQNKIKLEEGTRLYGEAVIVSALFDEDGFLRRIRAVTDPRVTPLQREHAIALRNFLLARYGTEGWTCEDLPREEGESDFGGSFLKERCEKTVDDREVSVEGRYLRREGQYGIDPVTRQAVEGLFVSETRFEMGLIGEVPNRRARLAALASDPAEPSEAEANRQKALNCPGCDLSGIVLKRQNLAGANLAGANLSGANLHGANLSGANLAGADLSGANLNKADLRRANLTGLTAREAMFFGARLEGADLAGGDLTQARMSEAALVSADLSGATLAATDLSYARMGNADLRNADIRNALMHQAQMNRADLSGASLLTVDLSLSKLVAADLSGARLWGTDLFGADLRDATLIGTDFTGSRLTGALTTGADMEGAVFVDITRD